MAHAPLNRTRLHRDRRAGAKPGIF